VQSNFSINEHKFTAIALFSNPVQLLPLFFNELYKCQSNGQSCICLDHEKSKKEMAEAELSSEVVVLV
jgi:hypothetical protein